MVRDLTSAQYDKVLTVDNGNGCITTQMCIFFFFVFFLDRVSLYSPGCPGTHFVDQAGLELRNSPASASQVLGLKACATTPGIDVYLMTVNYTL